MGSANRNNRLTLSNTFVFIFPSLSLLSLACNRPPAGLYDVKSTTVDYVTRGTTKLYMDVFTPINAPAPRPAVVLFHGGGWVVGDRSDECNLAAFLASMGYTAATASYRLCTEQGPHYPIPMQDALAAVKYMRSHAADFGADPTRIAVGGESAGGQLALMIGLVKDHAIFGDDSHAGVSTEVSAVINIYGPSDLSLLFAGSGFVVQKLALAYLGCTPRDCPEKWKAASPVTYVRKDAPPVLTIQGDNDTVVPYAQAETLQKAIQAVGGRSRLVRVRGAGHGWGLLFNAHENMRTLPAITQFLAHVFPAAP
ncbi:MAG: alpha/beta hydrolase [Planctomycetota bacterium]